MRPTLLMQGTTLMAHQSDLIASDILAYLKQHENKDLLRFITCGNVDDGKSTLIGRLLHDSKLIFEDQLAAIQRDSKKWHRDINGQRNQQQGKRNNTKRWH